MVILRPIKKKHKHNKLTISTIVFTLYYFKTIKKFHIENQQTIIIK